MNNSKYDALDPLIKKKYDKRFVRSVCGIDDLLERRRYIYDLQETCKDGDMDLVIELLNNLYDENQVLQDKLDLHILLTDDERHKVSRHIKKLEKENQSLTDTVEALQSELAHYE